MLAGVELLTDASWRVLWSQYTTGGWSLLELAQMVEVHPSEIEAGFEERFGDETPFGNLAPKRYRFVGRCRTCQWSAVTRWQDEDSNQHDRYGDPWLRMMSSVRSHMWVAHDVAPEEMLDYNVEDDIDREIEEA